jgi:NAD(P)-dependent dehydrogenase (short-subunit alcohol dehydrogenase family)
MKSFQDKVAVITGAGSGLGRSLALQLATAGADLALCDLNSTGLEETHRQIGENAKVSLHIVDVSSREQMHAFAQAVMAQFERIEILFNNAGITLTPTFFEEISDAQFEKVISINLWGVYNGKVNIAPSRGDGAPLGAWVPANASQDDTPAAQEHVRKLMMQKYGFSSFGWLNFLANYVRRNTQPSKCK